MKTLDLDEKEINLLFDELQKNVRHAEPQSHYEKIVTEVAEEFSGEAPKSNRAIKIKMKSKLNSPNSDEP